MATAIATPSRRRILGALAFAPAVAAIPAIAALPAGSNDFDACVKRLEIANREYLTAATRFSDAQELYFASAPQEPHGLVLAAKGRAFTMDEAAANMKAEHRSWQKADRACRDRCGVDSAEESVAAALSAEAKAVDALLLCPAPNLRAVAKKIEIAIEYACDIDELDPLFADLRRLGGEA